MYCDCAGRSFASAVADDAGPRSAPENRFAQTGMCPCEVIALWCKRFQRMGVGRLSGTVMNRRRQYQMCRRRPRNRPPTANRPITILASRFRRSWSRRRQLQRDRSAGRHCHGASDRASAGGKSRSDRAPPCDVPTANRAASPPISELSPPLPGHFRSQSASTSPGRVQSRSAPMALGRHRSSADSTAPGRRPSQSASKSSARHRSSARGQPPASRRAPRAHSGRGVGTLGGGEPMARALSKPSPIAATRSATSLTGLSGGISRAGVGSHGLMLRS